MRITRAAQVSVLALATALAIPTAAFANGLPEKYERPISAPGSRDDTRAYLGVSWSLGANASFQPSFVVGVQSIRVRSSNRLRGIDVNARFNFTDGFERVAIAGLIGRRDVYANIGGGFNIRQGEPFGTVAVQGPFLRAGLDVGLTTGNWDPYFEINTLDRPRRVAGGGLSCPENYTLMDSLFAPPGAQDLVIDDQICVDDFWFD